MWQREVCSPTLRLGAPDGISLAAWRRGTFGNWSILRCTRMGSLTEGALLQRLKQAAPAQ